MKAPTNIRQLFRPKFPETPTQCASCPFRKDNAKEFGAVVDRLRAANGLGKATKTQVFQSRETLHAEAMRTGDFICHATVYDAKMKTRPRNDWKQCKGATEAFRNS